MLHGSVDRILYSNFTRTEYKRSDVNCQPSAHRVVSDVLFDRRSEGKLLPFVHVRAAQSPHVFLVHVCRQHCLVVVRVRQVARVVPAPPGGRSVTPEERGDDGDYCDRCDENEADGESQDVQVERGCLRVVNVLRCLPGCRV